MCVSWGAARGVVPSLREAFEMYIRQAGLNPLPPGRHELQELWDERRQQQQREQEAWVERQRQQPRKRPW